jgi:tripartite-type tricarboxylate transporter receptor subunit TctC
MARFYAQHMGDYIAGHPTIIVQNMPGAGSLVATVNLFNNAPRDGTRLGVVGGGTVWRPILGNPQATYDSRQFAWIGGMSRDDITCVSWDTIPIHTIEDVIKRETVVGATGPGSRTLSIPKALNEILGTKFKIVSGYPGGTEIGLALQKGEVEAYCGWALGAIKRSAADAYRDHKLRFLVQFAATKDPELQDVPLGTDLAPDESARRVMEFLTSDSVLAWTLLAPPGLPQTRVAELRKAFDTMLKDPQIVAAGAKEQLEIDPVSGDELQQLVARLYTTPADVVARIKEITGEK